MRASDIEVGKSYTNGKHTVKVECINGPIWAEDPEIVWYNDGESTEYARLDVFAGWARKAVES